MFDIEAKNVNPEHIETAYKLVKVFTQRFYDFGIDLVGYQFLGDVESRFIV